jgi:hypothetical protein
MNLPLFEPEVKANLERAEESLRAAQLLYAWSWDFWNFCKRPARTSTWGVGARVSITAS